MSTFGACFRRRYATRANRMPSAGWGSALVMSPYFFAAGIGCPVALSASGRNYRGTKVEVREDSKKESGEAKGEVGGCSARGRIHVGRLLQIGRHGCSPKITAWLQCGYVFAILRAPHLLRRSRSGARVIVGLDRQRHRFRLSSRQAMALGGTAPRQAIRQTTPGR